MHRFGPYQQLVSPASDSKYFEQNLGSDDAPTHGVRAQICVTDYNRDGRLDLILGDCSEVNWKRDLNEAERVEFDDLMEIQIMMLATAAKLREAFSADQETSTLRRSSNNFRRSTTSSTAGKKHSSPAADVQVSSGCSCEKVRRQARKWPKRSDPKTSRPPKFRGRTKSKSQ
jgi:hypothetical protein